MKSSKLFLKLLVAIALLNSRAGAFLDHWNAGSGGKPSRNGLTWERGPTNATVLWQGGLDAMAGFTVSMEGDVVVASRVNFFTSDVGDAQNGALLVAHELESGQILWTNSLPIDFPATDWFSLAVGIRDKRVYATRSGNNNDSYLFALNAETGQVLWRSQDTINICVSESPSFAPNGDLIVGSFNRLIRIDATSGARIWSASRFTPASGSGEPAIYGDSVYVWEQSGAGPKISVFDLGTGTKKYSSPGLGGIVQQVGPFVGPDGIVYAPRSAQNTNTDYLVAFEDTGSGLVEKWRTPLGYVPFASFAIGPDGSVYSYASDFRVIRIRPQDGMIINSSTNVLTTGYCQPRMVIDSAGILFVSNGAYPQSSLFSFDPDLRQRWEVTIGNMNTGGPAIGKNGTLVIAGNGTDVRAYRGNSYGQPGPPVQISRDVTNLVITFSGILEAANQINGPWTNVPGAVSPLKVSVDRAQQFYRSRQE